MTSEIFRAYSAAMKKFPRYRFGYNSEYPTSMSVSTHGYKPNVVAPTVLDGTAREYYSQYIEMLKELKGK